MKVTWKNCFKIGLSVLIVYLFIHYFDLLRVFVTKALGAAIPLVIGCGLAYIVNILMTFYEKYFFPYTKKNFIKKIRRPICLALAALSLVGIIMLIVSLILPQLVSCTQMIIAQIPGALEKTVSWLNNWGFVPKDIINELSAINWKEQMGQILETFTSYFGNMVNIVFSVITSVFSVLVGALLSIIFALYLLIAKDRLISQTNSIIDCYLKPETNRRVRYVFRVLNDSFHNYIVGQSTEAVILGLLCMIGMMIFGLPYASMIGALVAFTALIPVVGAYAGAIIGAFMISMINPMDAFIFLVFIIILQQFEGNIIYPKVVGTSLGLPGMWVLAAVTIGGGVLGVPGMLFGVPLAAAIYRIIRHDVRKKSRDTEQKLVEA